ncbi:uncharacterized protein LOC113306310 [Papaver somniferum]|uniref:uncharacterized protein LOC113306310 n=1 Tax=Papaver somniferum TaxID=3469 RepID=UPI000E701363|nr:uncharacterized protein LOC113306310 [Papaver somniferum]
MCTPIEINVDAAFISNNGAAGAIARDHNGMFLGCVTGTFDSTSSLLAESLACKLGVELGIRFGLTKVIIEGDALNVTAAVLGNVSDIPWSIRSVILEVRELSNSFTDINFVSVPKSANNGTFVMPTCCSVWPYPVVMLLCTTKWMSLSDDESCTGFTETSKIKHLTEGHEQLKPLLSEGWEYIFKGAGQVFHGGVDEVRLAVSKYCKKYGYTVAKVKNDRLRFTGKCGRNAECPWYLHCIPIDTAKSVFAIKEFNGEHKCGGAYKLKDPPVKKKLIKHLFKDQIQSNPSIKPNDMVAQVKSCYGIDIKYHHAYKGKETSKAEIYGDDRLFICFAACMEGYRFIRPMLYCDATFLNGRFKGTLMAATGFFLFAYALVPGEDIEGWEWFIENLQHCIESRPITFIIDRHEGLKQSIPKYFPNSYHSYCFHHLKNNLPIKKSHEKYKQVQDLFHKAASCYSVDKYESTLNEMCIIGCSWVSKYIRNIYPKHWENAFSVGCRYGTHSSTIAESFNNWILPERDMPPAALVNEIRIKIMRMSAERRELGRNYSNSFTPIYKSLLKSHVDIGRPWSVTESALLWFESFSHTYAPAIRPIPNYDSPEAYEPEERVLPGIPRPPPGRPPKKRIRGAYEKERRPMKYSNCKKIGNHNKATCRVLMLE